MAQPTPSTKVMWRSDRRIYLDKDGKVVTEKNREDAVKLLVAVNGEIPLDDAKRYGLVKEKPKAEKAEDPEPDEFEIADLASGAVGALKKAGLYSAEKLNETSDEDLLKIEGIGEKSVEAIRAALKD